MEWWRFPVVGTEVESLAKTTLGKVAIERVSTMMKKSNRPAMEAGKAPKDNTLAVTDMAIAFGQGSPLPWSPDAVATGAEWVKARLDQGAKNYWTSKGARDKALALARRVGTKAADEAMGQMISEANVVAAIQGVLSEGMMAGCPFD